MRFGVSYGNHGDGTHVEDVIVYIRNALLAAGQEAYILPGLLTEGMNVLLEYFLPEQAWQIAQIKRRGRARFVVVVSEFTDGKRFNSHITSGAGHYVDSDYWQRRFETFMEVAAEAEAIWSLSEYSLPQYRALFPDKPVLSFPIAFDPRFPLVEHPPSGRKDIDLLFTGHVTPHRKLLLAELGHRFTVMTAPATTLTVSRLDFIRRSKASLHLNLLENAMYSSVMRHHFLIMSGSPVISERAETVGPLDEFITQFDRQNFVDRVAGFLASGEWERRGAAMRERYRDMRPIAGATKRLLALSIES